VLTVNKKLSILPKNLAPSATKIIYKYSLNQLEFIEFSLSFQGQLMLFAA